MKFINRITVIFLILVSRPAQAQEFRSVSAGNQIIEAEVHKPVSFKLDTAIKQDWNPSDKIQVVNNSWRHSKNLSFLSVSGIFYIWAPIGEHSLTGEMLLVNWTKQDILQKSFMISVIISPASVIPDPTPDPIPPTPITNNPFGTENKLRLLIVEEQTQRATLPPKQKEILESARVRDFLDDAGAEWRILDANTEFASDSIWKKALKLNSTVPGIIISNGKKWQALPLPQNVEEVMKLFIEYTK